MQRASLNMVRGEFQGEGQGRGTWEGRGRRWRRLPENSGMKILTSVLVKNGKRNRVQTLSLVFVCSATHRKCRWNGPSSPLEKKKCEFFTEKKLEAENKFCFYISAAPGLREGRRWQAVAPPPRSPPSWGGEGNKMRHGKNCLSFLINEIWPNLKKNIKYQSRSLTQFTWTVRWWM